MKVEALSLFISSVFFPLRRYAFASESVQQARVPLKRTSSISRLLLTDTLTTLAGDAIASENHLPDTDQATSLLSLLRVLYVLNETALARNGVRMFVWLLFLTLVFRVCSKFHAWRFGLD